MFFSILTKNFCKEKKVITNKKNSTLAINKKQNLTKPYKLNGSFRLWLSYWHTFNFLQLLFK